MCPLSVAFGVEIGSPRVSPLLGIGALHVGLSTLGRVIVPCLNHHPAQDPHGVKAEDWKEFLSRPRGQLRVAPEARALFPLQTEKWPHLRLGLWAHSTLLGWQSPWAEAISDHQGSVPGEGWEFCDNPFILLGPWSQGLGRGLPAVDMGPCSAQPPEGRSCVLLRPLW